MTCNPEDFTAGGKPNCGQSDLVVGNITEQGGGARVVRLRRLLDCLSSSLESRRQKVGRCKHADNVCQGNLGIPDTP